MSQKSKAGKRAQLEKKIDEFCESSVQLLSGIHAKYNNPDKSKKRKKKKKKSGAISDLGIKTHDNGHFDDVA